MQYYRVFGDGEPVNFVVKSELQAATTSKSFMNISMDRKPPDLTALPLLQVSARVQLMYVTCSQ